jgi:hypothetical protein
MRGGWVERGMVPTPAAFGCLRGPLMPNVGPRPRRTGCLENYCQLRQTVLDGSPESQHSLRAGLRFRGDFL